MIPTFEIPNIETAVHSAMKEQILRKHIRDKSDYEFGKIETKIWILESKEFMPFLNKG